MISYLLKKREYPFIIFLGIPENNLDLFTFLIFVVYIILKINFKFPIWSDLITSIIFLIITLLFFKYNKKNNYTHSLNHSKAFSIFFFIRFLLNLIQ